MLTQPEPSQALQGTPPGGGSAAAGVLAGELVERLAAVVERLEAIAAGQSGPAPRFLTVEGAHQYTGLSADSIRAMLERGDLTALPPVRGRVLIDREELDRAVLGSVTRPRGGRGQWRRSRHRGLKPGASDQQGDASNTEGCQ